MATQTLSLSESSLHQQSHFWDHFVRVLNDTGYLKAVVTTTSEDSASGKIRVSVSFASSGKPIADLVFDRHIPLVVRAEAARGMDQVIFDDLIEADLISGKA